MNENPFDRRLRLECELFLIAGNRERALQIYDRLADNGDPYLQAARARILEDLDENRAVDSLKQALKSAGESEEEILQAVSLAGGEGALGKYVEQRTAVQKTVLVDSPVKNLSEKKLAWENTEVITPSSSAGLAGQVTEILSARRETKKQQSLDEGISGKDFGRYQIEKKLGEGGMGTVYKVWDTELERTVALKVIRGEGVSNAKMAQRFLQEVKATARLQHPNIVAIYDFGENPQYYFTMEYMTGKTLAEVIGEGIFKSKKAAKTLGAICSAIACAHEEKIIHRDLKPGNIMGEDNSAKVMDFGLAKFLESESGISRSGDIIGTPTYMSPEQAAGNAVDERSDIYSIGAIGYEMVTGKPVFQGSNVYHVLDQVAAKEPERPRLINSGIDSDLETILLKCLEKSPNRRYQSARKLGEEIERYMEDRPILAKPPSLPARVAKWMRRNKEFAAAAAIVILCIFGIFAYITFQWRQLVNYNKAMSIISDVMTWDKQMVDYQAEVKPRFQKAEKLSQNYIVYHKWGLFCFSYAQAQLNKKGNFSHHIKERNRYYAEAIEKLKKACELNPCDYTSVYYLLFMHWALEDKEAVEKYDRQLHEIITRLDPENGIKYQTLAIDAINKALGMKGKKREALRQKSLALYNKAIRYDPMLPCSHNGLGIIYRQIEEFESAKKHLDRCIEITPTYRYAYLNRGRLYLAWGLALLKKLESTKVTAYLENAQRDYERVIALQPDSEVYHGQVQVADVYYELAEVYALQKNKPKSIKNLQKAIEHDFADMKRMRDDPNLDFVKDDEKFLELLKR